MIEPGHMMAQLNRLVFSILLIGKREQEAGWHHPPRQRRFHSFWLITRGKGTFILDGKPYTAEPGKIFILTPQNACERLAGSEGLEYYMLRFSYTAAYEDRGQWKYQSESEVPFPLVGGYSIQNPSEITSFFEQIHHLWPRKGPMMMMRKKILFQELWVAIVNDFRAQKVTGHPAMGIDLTIDYMVNHYKEKITLNELASLAGLSASHYSRLFKQYIGHSPIDYLARLRVDRAKELMILSDYKLREIAETVGYKDAFYFSRLFKKMVGCSPSEYAKDHQAHPDHPSE